MGASYSVSVSTLISGPYLQFGHISNQSLMFFVSLSPYEQNISQYYSSWVNCLMIKSFFPFFSGNSHDYNFPWFHLNRLIQLKVTALCYSADGRVENTGIMW